MPITALYASLLAALFLLLSVRVIAQRKEARVEIGPGESKELLRRMRVHASFAEYVPYALLLLALAESLKVPPPLLHLIGLVLVAGRIIHAYGLSQNPHIMRYRALGITLSFVAIGAAALICFGYAVFNLII